MGSFCGKQQIDLLEVKKPSNLLGIRDFKYIATLGKGAYSKVILVKRKKTESFFAIKIYKKSSGLELQKIRNERKVLLDAVHPFFIRLFNIFESQSKISFVLEFVAGGNLGFHISRLGSFSIQTATFYAAEVLQGLEVLHGLGYVFRDLKPDNVLIDKTGHVKFADFNLTTSRSAYVVENTGTPEYAAPEILMQDEQGPEVDFWAFGVLIYHMIQGFSPFYANSADLVMENILDGRLGFNKYFNEASKDLITRLLKKYPSERLCNFKEIKNHKFFAMIDWNLVNARTLESPLKLSLKSETDLKYFMKKRYSKLVIDEKADESCCSDFSYNSELSN